MKERKTPAPPPPPPPNHDYDPFVARKARRGRLRRLIAGGVGFLAGVFICFFCIALTVIDVLNLWCDLPVLVDIVRALNFGC